MRLLQGLLLPLLGLRLFRENRLRLLLRRCLRQGLLRPHQRLRPLQGRGLRLPHRHWLRPFLGLLRPHQWHRLRLLPRLCLLHWHRQRVLQGQGLRLLPGLRLLRGLRLLLGLFPPLPLRRPWSRSWSSAAIVKLRSVSFQVPLPTLGSTRPALRWVSSPSAPPSSPRTAATSPRLTPSRPSAWVRATSSSWRKFRRAGGWGGSN